MFTGIIKQQGVVNRIVHNKGHMKLSISAEKLWENANIDESISINGVCLTIVNIKQNILSFDVLPETLKRSNLGKLEVADKVNIEQSLSLQDKLGGHMLQGHIDDVAEIIDMVKEGDSLIITLKINIDYVKMLVEKAYIALDGVSLTIIAVGSDFFKVMLIPHTVGNTILQHWQKGTLVNVEVDIMNKSIYNYMKQFLSKNIG